MPKVIVYENPDGSGGICQCTPHPKPDHWHLDDDAYYQYHAGLELYHQNEIKIGETVGQHFARLRDNLQQCPRVVIDVQKMPSRKWRNCWRLRGGVVVVDLTTAGPAELVIARQVILEEVAKKKGIKDLATTQAWRERIAAETKDMTAERLDKYKPE